MIINKIVNSHIFKFFPRLIQTKLLSNIVYFEKTNIKKLPVKNYDQQENLKIIFNKQINFKKKKLLKLSYTFPKLPKIIKKFYPKEKFNFLDYGGGEIKNFLYLILFFKKLNYFYKDKKYLENFFKKQKVLRKFNQFNLFGKKHDYEIIHFGSSFQYIENINLTLNSIISKKTKIIIISGIIIFEGIPNDKFICIQRNIQDKKFYQYFFNKKYLLNIFFNYDFKLKKIFHNKTDKYMNFKNFKKGNFKYIDLIFLKS